MSWRPWAREAPASAPAPAHTSAPAPAAAPASAPAPAAASAPTYTGSGAGAGAGVGVGSFATSPSLAPGERARDISLSLVSHTNVGKTTLARTLLGRDIGEVRDQAHVTQQAEAHVLLESPAGDRLLLWDTPGFGDSLRLAARLARVGSPLGWLLTEVWDRWRDRPFWASQHAVRHVLGQADVVLYLVNASEAPEDAPYLAAELQVLALVGKPVVAVLNQLGPPGQADEAAQLARWRSHLMGLPTVREVLALDAFTRCWVHEALLWQAVARQLTPSGAAPGPAAPGTGPREFVGEGGQAAASAALAGQALAASSAPVAAAWARLVHAWQARQWSRWQQAMDELARRLARAALDHEPLPPEGWRDAVGQWGTAAARKLGQWWGPRGGAGERDSAATAAQGPSERALAELAARLDADVQSSMQVLIRLHQLEGEAGRDLLARLARHAAVRVPVNEGQAALWGGLVTGALAGLKADLASGGLTLGGGLLLGGVLGALGAAGAAHGLNRVRGVSQPEVAWDERVLQALLANALLGWLAVAHHGRGRGAWLAPEPPSAWQAAVDAVLQAHAPAWSALWAARSTWLGRTSAGGRGRPPADEAVVFDPLRPVDAAGRGAAPPAAPAPTALPAQPEGLAQWQAALSQQMAASGLAVLRRLYPDATEAASPPA